MFKIFLTMSTSIQITKNVKRMKIVKHTMCNSIYWSVIPLIQYPVRLDMKSKLTNIPKQTQRCTLAKLKGFQTSANTRANVLKIHKYQDFAYKKQLIKSTTRNYLKNLQKNIKNKTEKKPDSIGLYKNAISRFKDKDAHEMHCVVPQNVPEPYEAPCELFGDDFVLFCDFFKY